MRIDPVREDLFRNDSTDPMMRIKGPISRPQRTRAGTINDLGMSTIPAIVRKNQTTKSAHMKWSSVENTKGTFTFGNADSEVGEAVCHNMKIRGQNLVWATGAQTPSYALGDGTNSPANQATVTANIQEHIQNEVTHFGDKVYVWDVVNEPIDPTQSDCLVHGPFYNVLGKSYIDIALEAAAICPAWHPIVYQRLQHRSARSAGLPDQGG